jgi:two-component system sensor histidine kinase KdpD
MQNSMKPDRTTQTDAPRAEAQRERDGSVGVASGATAMAELAYATAVTALAVIFSALAERSLGFTDLSLVFITAVLFVAVRTRMSLAVYAAVLCFLAYNFFFIHPRYTFYIAAGRSVATVVMFLVAALICGRLANRLRTQVILLRAAHAHTEALHTLGQQLATAADEGEVFRAGLGALRQAMGAEVVILSMDDATATLVNVASAPDDPDLEPDARAAAEWRLLHGQTADRGTDARHSPSWWCLPLSAGGRSLGMVCLRFSDRRAAPSPDLTNLAQAMVHAMAGASARTRLVTQLELARVQGETERLRAALLSSVSHDLRSPLATIVGSAESLSVYRDKLSREDQAVLAENILIEGQRLDRYIQNLLDMTRLGHGTLTIHREWVGLDELCGALLPRLRRLCPPTEIELQIPADLPLLYVNPALIEQALFNVLENAAKFSPSDQPVTLSAARCDGELQIRISDRGPGVPEEERQRIFDMFYSVGRGDRENRAKPGTGLGLAICQGIVAAHGGHVMALPGDDGQGTSILMTLPLIDPPIDQPRED